MFNPLVENLTKLKDEALVEKVNEIHKWLEDHSSPPPADGAATSKTFIEIYQIVRSCLPKEY